MKVKVTGRFKKKWCKVQENINQNSSEVKPGSYRGTVELFIDKKRFSLPCIVVKGCLDSVEGILPEGISLEILNDAYQRNSSNFSFEINVGSDNDGSQEVSQSPQNVLSLPESSTPIDKNSFLKQQSIFGKETYLEAVLVGSVGFMGIGSFVLLCVSLEVGIALMFSGFAIAMIACLIHLSTHHLTDTKPFISYH